MVESEELQRLQELTQQLWQAAEQRKVCRLQLLHEPVPRVVHVYGLCQTNAHHVVCVCWQTHGFTKAGARAGYRNINLEKIETIEVLHELYHVRTDFNPADGQYKDWVFHV